MNAEALAIIAKHVGHPTAAQRACLRAGLRLTMGQVRHAMERFADDAPMRLLGSSTPIDLRAPWQWGSTKNDRT
jgi:hypothetical protein